jgi:hypothetical protein
MSPIHQTYGYKHQCQNAGYPLTALLSGQVVEQTNGDVRVRQTGYSWAPPANYARQCHNRNPLLQLKVIVSFEAEQSPAGEARASIP